MWLRHPDGMNKGRSWEGLALPRPPAGENVGKPGFPTPLLQRDEKRSFLGGPGPLTPSRGRECGETRFPHPPAPPRRDEKRLFLGGPGLPTPSRGRECGETRFPHPLLQRDEKRLFLGGRSPPTPSRGPGPGCAGLRLASAEGWGNPVSPSPCSSAAPSHTLPRVGAWGHPVSPCPCGAGAWGNPVSPSPSSEGLCSR